MTDLIACLSTGKGTWGHVARLIQEGTFEQIFLVAPEFAKEKFTAAKPVQFVTINENKPIQELINDIKSQLEGKVKGTEVALNFISGSGKEHMALLAALLKLGLGIRMVSLTTEGMQEI